MKAKSHNLAAKAFYYQHSSCRRPSQLHCDLIEWNTEKLTHDYLAEKNILLPILKY